MSCPAPHLPVLLPECLELLRPVPGEVAIDLTLGAGGHAVELLRAIHPGGQLIGVDQDPSALELAGARLAAFSDAELDGEGDYRLVRANFGDLPALADEIPRGDVVLADLGVSSMQLDQGHRGFSFRTDAPLDLRMDPTRGEPASGLLARLSEAELADLLFTLGEERWSRRIAARVVRQRDTRAVQSTGELADLVRQSYPPNQRHDRIHPATRTFQALRIAVNDELGALDRLLETLPHLLRPGGRLAIISYHSLEDRRVKQSFLSWARGCTCPPRLPVCVCGRKPLATMLTRKPVTPGPDELARNPRSRSARLRALVWARGAP